MRYANLRLILMTPNEVVVSQTSCDCLEVARMVWDFYRTQSGHKVVVLDGSDERVDPTLFFGKD